MTGPVPLRRLAWRLPEALQPQPKRSLRVMAFDGRGRTVHDLQPDATDYHFATGVREHDGRVWLGSLEEAAVAVLDVR